MSNKKSKSLNDKVKFQVTTWERVILKNILQGYARQNLSLGEVRTGLVILDALELTDAEKESIQLDVRNEMCQMCGTVLPSGEFRWDKDNEPEWDLSLPKESLTWFLAIALKAKYPMDPQTPVLEDKLKHILSSLGK